MAEASFDGVNSTVALMDEARVEELLSEKLMGGYLLLDRACPRCLTPLVKQEEGRNDTIQPDINAAVPGVPFCVGCRAHVTTDEAHINTLQSHFLSQALQGRVLIDFQEDPEKGRSLIDDDETVESQTSGAASSAPQMDKASSRINQRAHKPLINVADTEAIELICSVSLAGRDTTTSLDRPVRDVWVETISDAESIVASVMESFDEREDQSRDHENPIARDATPSAESRTSTQPMRVSIQHSKTIVKARTELTEGTETSTPASNDGTSPVSKTVVKAHSVSTTSTQSSSPSPLSEDGTANSDKSAQARASLQSSSPHNETWPKFEER